MKHIQYLLGRWLWELEFYFARRRENKRQRRLMQNRAKYLGAKL